MYVNTESITDNSKNTNEHFCCIYSTNEELLSLIIPFFIQGLQKNNKCMYILGEQSQDEIMKAFSNSGFDLSPSIIKKDFIFASYEDIYFKNNTFDVRNATSSLVSAESDALKQGYSALRVAGGTSWIPKKIPIISEFIKYEALVNDFIKDSYIIAACLYKESLFDLSTLVDVLYNHPSVYLHDKLIENTYYKPLYNLQATDSSRLTYEEITNELYGKQH